MTDTEAELLAEALSKPNILWRVLTNDNKILGPWLEDKSIGKGGYRRLGPLPMKPYTHTQYLIPNVTIYWSSKPPPEPEEYDFYEWGGVDWEGYNEAVKEWKAECARWKPWKYYFSLRLITVPYGYADTKEEAQQAVDNVLTGLGYLLYNGD